MPNFGNSTAPSLGNVLRWLAKFHVIFGHGASLDRACLPYRDPLRDPLPRGFQIQHSRATNGMFCCWQTNKRCSVSASHFGQNEMSEPLTTTLLMWDGSQWVSILLLTVSSGQSPFSRYIAQTSPTSETFAEVFYYCALPVCKTAYMGQFIMQMAFTPALWIFYQGFPQASVAGLQIHHDTAMTFKGYVHKMCNIYRG